VITVGAAFFCRAMTSQFRTQFCARMNFSLSQDWNLKTINGLMDFPQSIPIGYSAVTTLPRRLATDSLSAYPTAVAS
jgi:hypothetical protein